MRTDKPDKKADIVEAIDRGETHQLMEPLVLSADSRFRGECLDLAMELAGRAAGLRKSLPKGVCSSLAKLVRSMNCYYSNLIEGHNTHPIDIERALRNEYSTDSRQRDLQLEAKAHITVQAWIDEGGINGKAASVSVIHEIHRRFGEMLPDDLLWSEDPVSGERCPVLPGELRQRDVKVGKHVPVSPGAVPRFLHRFEQAYAGLGTAETIVNLAAAHHRLLWIHPFADGNGRVARLLSHATLLQTLDTGAIWSIARGLARNEKSYKQHLANCDQQRRNDLDGGGNLSEEALARFCRFFLETCLDQVSFLEGLVQPVRLQHRLLSWAKEEVALGSIPPKSERILEAILYRGELPRSETPRLLGVGERQARRLVAALCGHGVVESASPRAPLRLAFPACLAPRLMPGLFPE